MIIVSGTEEASSEIGIYIRFAAGDCGFAVKLLRLAYEVDSN